MSKNFYENDFDFDEEDAELKVSQYCAQRRLQKKQMERKVRQSQMWLKRFRVLTRLSIISLLVFVGFKLLKLPQWYLNKDAFNSLNNPYLEIANNKIVPSYKILAALRQTKVPNTPIYRFDTSEIKQDIMQLDPVENVYVRRLWFPARLQIIIEERTPIITISPKENVAPIAFFASGGKLIGRDYMPLPKSAKTVRVLTYGSKGDDYRNWDNEKIKLLENVAKAVKAGSNEEVQYIDLRNAKDVYVRVKTANIRLGKLDDTVFSRIERIPSILPQIKTLDKKIKYIDLRWKNANYIKLG
jgi:cell division septal protein FtsQ